MDSVPNPARVTISLLNPTEVAINLGPITMSGGVFNLYSRCVSGTTTSWCASTPSVGNGLQAIVSNTCANQDGGGPGLPSPAPASVGTPVVLYSNSTSISTPKTGVMYSLYGQYFDSSCRAILRVMLNFPGQVTRSFWIRQVVYTASGPWGYGPAPGLNITVPNGRMITVDMGAFPAGSQVFFKLFYLLSGAWTEPTDYTFLSGNCLPALPVAPVAPNYPILATSATASWGQLSAPLGARRDSSCNVVAQISMNSQFGPLEQVYVIKSTAVPVDKDPYAAYALVRQGETTVVSLGVIPLNTTTLGLYLPAAEGNGTLWPVPTGTLGATQTITIGAECAPSGVGVAAVYWYGSGVHRRALAAAASGEAASSSSALSPAQLSSAFSSALAGALGLSADDVTVTVQPPLPSLATDEFAAQWAVYETLPAAPPTYWHGIDEETRQPLPPAEAAAIAAVTGKPSIPAALADGTAPPVDADGMPTIWASSAGVPADTTTTQISVQITVPDRILALPRSQWPPALQAAIPAGSSGGALSSADVGAALTAALASPAVAAALEAQGIPAASVTLPNATGGSAWITTGVAASPATGGSSGAGSGGASSSGAGSTVSSSGGLSSTTVAGVAAGCAAAVALAGALVFVAARRRTAAALGRKALATAEGAEEGAAQAAEGPAAPSATASELPPTLAQPESLTHILTGSTSPSSKRFTAAALVCVAPPGSASGSAGSQLASTAGEESVAPQPAPAIRACVSASAVLPLVSSSASSMPEAATEDASDDDGDGPDSGGRASSSASNLGSGGALAAAAAAATRVLEEDSSADPAAGGAPAHPETLLFTRSFKSPAKTTAIAASAAASAAWGAVAEGSAASPPVATSGEAGLPHAVPDSAGAHSPPAFPVDAAFPVTPPRKGVAAATAATPSARALNASSSKSAALPRSPERA